MARRDTVWGTVFAHRRRNVPRRLHHRTATERFPTAMAWVPASVSHWRSCLCWPSSRRTSTPYSYSGVSVLSSTTAIWGAVQHRSGRRQQSLTCNRHRRAADPRLQSATALALFRGLHEDLFMQQQLLHSTPVPAVARGLQSSRRSALKPRKPCRTANSTGLKYSMAATASIFLIASGAS